MSKSVYFIQKSQLHGISNLPVLIKKLSSYSHDNESTGFDYYYRKWAMKPVFKIIYPQAEPELWHEKQIVSGIIDRLGKVLPGFLEAEKHNEKYNAKSGVSRRGRKKLITEGSEEEAVILRCAADLS